MLEMPGSQKSAEENCGHGGWLFKERDVLREVGCGQGYSGGPQQGCHGPEILDWGGKE